MTTITGLFSRSEKIVRPRFVSELKPCYPSIEELLAKAERTTLSCRLTEQIDVSRLFYKDVALRGLNCRKYSVEEAKKVGIIVDYLAETRRRQLAPADAV